MRRPQVIVVVGWLILATAVSVGQESAEKETEPQEPVVYTNEDLPPAPASAPTTAPTQAPAAGSLPLPLLHDEVRDRNGHGEGWWRQRAAELDSRISEARINAELLHVEYVKGKTILDPTLASRSRAATQLLLVLEAERDALPEELRRAGGLPGWLRRSGGTLPSEPLPPPVPEAPTHTNALTLSWKPVRLAEFYSVELQCLDCCGPIEPCDVRSLDVSGTSARFPFEAGGSGRWRVRALDAAGFGGEWSAWLDFKHDPD